MDDLVYAFMTTCMPQEHSKLSHTCYASPAKPGLAVLSICCLLLAALVPHKNQEKNKRVMHSVVGTLPVAVLKQYKSADAEFCAHHDAKAANLSCSAEHLCPCARYDVRDQAAWANHLQHSLP